MINPIRHTVALTAVFILCLASSVRAANADSLSTALMSCDEDTTCLRLRLEICDRLLFSEPAEASDHCHEALELATELRDTLALARAHNYRGIIATIQAYYLTGIEEFQTAMHYFESLDDREGVVKLLNNIGVIYSMLENYRESINYYTECLALNRASGDHEGVAFNLYNIAGDYLVLEENDKAKSYIDSLISYQEINGEFIKAEALLGEYHLAEGELDSAESYLLFAQEVYRDLEEEHQLTSGFLSLAELYQKKGFFETSLRYLDSVNVSAKRFNLNDELMASHEIRAKVFNDMGLFRKAYREQLAFMSLRDSLNEINNFNRISELNARFESEKREKELAEKEAQLIQKDADKKFQKRIFIVVVGFVVLILIIVTVSLIRKRRINKILNAQNEEITDQRRKIISSISYAKKIQNATLIEEEKVREHLPESFIYFRPKDIVSGDFYWFTTVGNQVMMATIDCTGHGVPGAFMSLIANSKLNKVVNEMGVHDPGEILNKVHEEILSSLNQHAPTGSTQDGMDMSLCKIDRKNNRIEYAGARNPILLVNQDTVREIKPDSLSIGGSFFRDKHIENGGFSTQVIEYDKDTFLFMFTDGYMDQFGGTENKKLNKSRFHEILLEISRNGFEQAKEALDERLTNWRGRIAQIDDILIIGSKL